MNGAPRRQRGIALLTAIFVVVLATIAAVAMFEGSNIAVQRSANIGESEAAWWYAQGVEAWVTALLKNDKGQVNGLGDAWAQPIDFLPIDNGGLRGRLEDLQGRFNLNNLATRDPNKLKLYQEQFERLIEFLPDFDGFRYRGLSGAVRDWVDADDERSSVNGAEDNEYMGALPPYRAANQLMRSPGELLLVKGVTPELFRALKPYVTALPQVDSPINVNTAPLPVLMSLAQGLDLSAAKRFEQTRIAQPAKATTELTGSGGSGGFLPAQTVPLSVNTQFFELRAEVFVGRGRVALYSVIFRQGGGQPVAIAHSTDTE